MPPTLALLAPESAASRRPRRQPLSVICQRIPRQVHLRLSDSSARWAHADNPTFRAFVVSYLCYASTSSTKTGSSAAMDPDRFLPLRAVEFQILASLSQGPRHGYAILQDAEAWGEGRAVPGLATLYRAILRLEQGGLITRAKEAAGASDDDSRRTYTLTPLGGRVVAAEASRLADLVDLVRDGPQ